MVGYTEGLALILEGATEKVFYKNLLEYIQTLTANVKMQSKGNYRFSGQGRY